MYSYDDSLSCCYFIIITIILLFVITVMMVMMMMMMMMLRIIIILMFIRHISFRIRITAIVVVAEYVCDFGIVIMIYDLFSSHVGLSRCRLLLIVLLVLWLISACLQLIHRLTKNPKGHSKWKLQQNLTQKMLQQHFRPACPREVMFVMTMLLKRSAETYQRWLYLLNRL